jgi:PAS domain S-box-containing protein
LLRRSKTERLLAEAERLARLGSWEWEIESGRVVWSPQLYEIFGMDPAAFEPSLEHYLERVSAEDRERVRKLIEEARVERLSLAYECRIVLPNGDVRVIDARGRFETDDTGKSTRMWGTVQDITERNRMEEELARTRSELEQRTGELERSNRELERFAYDASHDLGEPLRVMAAIAERLARRFGGSLDLEGRRLLGSLVDGTVRMQMLVADLLEYSRVSREPHVRLWVDCRAVFSETLELLAESIEERGATVTASSLPTVEAHPAQMRQLLQNLISNALKFGGDEPLRVRVDARRVGYAWAFRIEDNGIGIDPADAERVFELFERINPTDAYAGTGVGLSICKRIVERHGGRIWVEQADGGGSRFCFTIPDPPNAMVSVLSAVAGR